MFVSVSAFIKSLQRAFRCAWLTISVCSGTETDLNLPKEALSMRLLRKIE